MLTYRGGGGSIRRPSSWPFKSSWTEKWRAVRWTPLIKSAAVRCFFTLLSIPLSVAALLALRLIHGAIVRTCVALLSIAPKGYPDLLYHSDRMTCPPKSHVYMFEVDDAAGADAFRILEFVVGQDPRFRMKLLYSYLGSNVWKNCDGSWNIRAHIKEEPLPSASLTDYMDRVLSESFLDGFPPWKAHVIKSHAGQVLVLYVHRALVSAFGRFEKPDYNRPLPEVTEDPSLWLTRELERWSHLWFSCPTVVLHRIWSQFRGDAPSDNFALASTRTIPASFVEALASRSERPGQDVLLSCVAGALRHAFHHLRGSCPVDMITAVHLSGSDCRAVSMPLWNYDPLTRLKRMTAAQKDPLDWKPGLIVTEGQEPIWRLPGGNTVKVLHTWSLDASGVHVHVTATKEGVHLDVSCRKDLLERPDVLASAIEREVQDLAIAVGLHRPQALSSLAVVSRALDAQVSEKTFWNTQLDRVCEFHRQLATLVLSTR